MSPASINKLACQSHTAKETSVVVRPDAPLSEDLAV